jgi:hypothetical protein
MLRHKITVACSIALIFGCLAFAGVAQADYGDRASFAPGWESETGYTVQDWGLHAVDDAEPAQPLTADNGYTNPYATPTAVWETQSPQGYYGWSQTAMGTHPSWVDETWGGMFAMSEPGTLTATVDPGDEDGSLKIWVEYDWYNYPGAAITATIDGATDITPTSYYDYELGQGSSGPWYRSIKVFEFAENPDEEFDVVFTGSGFATMLDSFEISTAIGSGVVVPASMPAPVPEPSVLLLLMAGAGVLAVLRKR